MFQIVLDFPKLTIEEAKERYPDLWFTCQQYLCVSEERLASMVSLIVSERNKVESEKLMWAYAQKIGSDSIIGLHVCDNFRDWVARLNAPKDADGTEI